MTAALRAPTPPNGDDDVALVERLQRGDRAALGALYDRHARAIHRFVARAASADEAEDVVHGVFVRAMERSEILDPARGAVRAWLFGIAAKMIQEWRRTLARRTRAYLRAGASEEAAGDGPSEGRELRRALEVLSEPKRLVLVLSEVEGFTCEEIAHMLAVPVGTVWTRLHHARNELRKLLR